MKKVEGKPNSASANHLSKQPTASNYNSNEMIAKEKKIWSNLLEALQRGRVIEDERICLYYDQRVKAMVERLPLEPNFNIRHWNEQLRIAYSVNKEVKPYPIFVRLNQGVHIITQDNYFAYKNHGMAQFIKSCRKKDGIYNWGKHTIWDAMEAAEAEEKREEKEAAIEKRYDEIIKEFEEAIGWKDDEDLDDEEAMQSTDAKVEAFITSIKKEPWYNKEKMEDAEELAPTNKITPFNITSLQPNEVFVFGSNSAGVHSGSAGSSALNFGAIRGISSGLQGQAYALPSEDLEQLAVHIKEFTAFAKIHPELSFLVTEVGCGTSNHSPLQVAPLFNEAAKLENIYLPPTFWDILKGGVGGRIKQLIETGGYSIPSFANETGIPARILTEIIFGKVEPSYTMLQKILIAIPECDVSWLIVGDDNKL